MKDEKLKHILIVHKNKDEHVQNPGNLWIEQLIMSLMKTKKAKVTTVTNDDDMDDVMKGTVDTILFVTGNSLMDARNVSNLFRGKLVIMSTDENPKNSVVILDNNIEDDPLRYLKIILN